MCETELVSVHFTWILRETEFVTVHFISGLSVSQGNNMHILHTYRLPVYKESNRSFQTGANL